MSTKEILEKAKAMIEDRSRWCQGGMAMDEKDRWMGHPEHGPAVRYCALGAIALAEGHDADDLGELQMDYLCLFDPVKALAAELEEFWFENEDAPKNRAATRVWIFNDKATHPAVLRAFESAIEKAAS